MCKEKEGQKYIQPHEEELPLQFKNFNSFLLNMAGGQHASKRFRTSTSEGISGRYTSHNKIDRNQIMLFLFALTCISQVVSVVLKVSAKTS